MAQGANIINVKAFFTFSERVPQTLPGDLEKALEGILDEHLANVANSPPGFRGSIVNLSLGKDKGRGDAVRNTLERFYMAGAPVVTAAGTFSDIPAAATTDAEVDDNTFDSIGDGSDIDTSEPTATASPTSDDRPKIITPTGDDHECLYVGCPDDYICNTVGNCVLD